jgi:hypothetical protein
MNKVNLRGKIISNCKLVLPTTNCNPPPPNLKLAEPDLDLVDPEEII